MPRPESCGDLFRRELGGGPSPAVWAAVDTAAGAASPPRLTGVAAARAQLQAGKAAIVAGAVDAGLDCLRRAVHESRFAGDDDPIVAALTELAGALVHSVRGRDEGAVMLHEAIDRRGPQLRRVAGRHCPDGTRQVQLARLLAGCDVEPLDDGQARSAGALAARAATTDIVDACVVEGAPRRRDLSAVLAGIIESVASGVVLAQQTSGVAWGPTELRFPWFAFLVGLGVITCARVMRIGVTMREDLDGTV